MPKGVRWASRPGFSRSSASIAAMTSRRSRDEELAANSCKPLPEPTLRAQASRCMDCGIPFCHDGCPVNNLIPDWNNLVYRDQWRQALTDAALDQQFPGIHRPHLPGAVRGVVHAEHRRQPGDDQNHRMRDRRSRLAGRLDRAAGRRRGAPASGSRWSAPGPPGMACAQQLARAGHLVTLFEKADRIGGLLRYGIPDFKMENMADRPPRRRRWRRKGSSSAPASKSGSRSRSPICSSEYDALAMTGGAEWPRDLEVPGRELAGIHFAMDFLPQQNKRNAGDDEAKAAPGGTISAAGKHVIVIGGGDTGSDCIGTSTRQGAASITQLEILPRPPEKENKALIWPDWPLKLRTSSSQEEGCERDWAVLTKRAFGANGHIEALECVRVEWAQAHRRPLEHAGNAGQRIQSQGRSGVAGDGLSRAAPCRHGGAVRGRRSTRAATSPQIRATTRRRCRRSSPPATCGAASRSSSGRSARAGNAPARSTSS